MGLGPRISSHVKDNGNQHFTIHNHITIEKAESQPEFKYFAVGCGTNRRLFRANGDHIQKWRPDKKRWVDHPHDLRQTLSPGSIWYYNKGWTSAAMDYPEAFPDADIPSPNPDPRYFRTKRVYEHPKSPCVLVEVEYPNCTHFEGRKLLVFSSKSEYAKCFTKREIDPHFHPTSGLIARFHPDHWELACTFVARYQWLQTRQQREKSIRTRKVWHMGDKVRWPNPISRTGTMVYGKVIHIDPEDGAFVTVAPNSNPGNTRLIHVNALEAAPVFHEGDIVVDKKGKRWEVLGMENQNKNVACIPADSAKRIVVNDVSIPAYELTKEPTTGEQKELKVWKVGQRVRWQNVFQPRKNQYGHVIEIISPESVRVRSEKRGIRHKLHVNNLQDADCGALRMGATQRPRKSFPIAAPIPMRELRVADRIVSVEKGDPKNARVHVDNLQDVDKPKRVFKGNPFRHGQRVYWQWVTNPKKRYTGTVEEVLSKTHVAVRVDGEKRDAVRHIHVNSLTATTGSMWPEMLVRWKEDGVTCTGRVVERYSARENHALVQYEGSKRKVYVHRDNLRVIQRSETPADKVVPIVKEVGRVALGRRSGKHPMDRSLTEKERRVVDAEYRKGTERLRKYTRTRVRARGKSSSGKNGVKQAIAANGEVGRKAGSHPTQIARTRRVSTEADLTRQRVRFEVT